MPEKMARERFARLVWARVEPAKLNELRKTYRMVVIPRERRQRGVRRIYLIQSTDTPHEVVSVSFWDSQRDAEAYEKSATHRQNVEKVGHLLSDVSSKSYRVLEHAVGPMPKKVGKKPV